MPSISLREKTRDQGCDEGIGVEGSIVDLKGGFAAAIITRIKVAHLGSQVAPQHACTDNEQEKGCEKPPLEPHAEMARRHQDRTERHSTSSTQYSIAEQSAKHGHEVNET